MSQRKTLIAILAIVAASGCRAMGVRDTTRMPAPLPPAPPPLSASELIERINRNAQVVENLRSDASIKVTAGREKHSVDGRMALERPRNFKLTLTNNVMGSHEADIGSNDQTCWFWVKRTREKEYYVCNYDEFGGVGVPSAFQPDWIVEALGLREIPDEEAARMTIARGGTETNRASQGTYLLTQSRKLSNGESIIKEMVVRETDGLILEHRLLNASKKTLLAQARINDVKIVEAKDGRKAVIPSKFRLSWIQEQLELDVQLGEPQINERLSQELWVEPTFQGFARVNLSDRAGLAQHPAAPPASEIDTLRESMPAPPVNSGAERARWTSVDNGSAARNQPAPSSGQATALRDLPEVETPRNLADEVVGARLPRPPGDY